MALLIYLPRAVRVETCEGLAASFIIVSPTEAFLCLLGPTFLHGHKNSMRNHHVYGDPDYSWDAYITT
jgi:hypothetical protein